MTDSAENAIKLPQLVAVDTISLDLSNPRHEPYKSEAEVIEYLCEEEYTLKLAKDIAENGLNPVESLAIIPNDEIGAHSTRYFVAEGNRRLCAIKLLNDPELAPEKYREKFKSIAKSATTDIAQVSAVIFEDREKIRLWLERIHRGLQGGIGRKTWGTIEQIRHFKDKQYAVAMRILDYAVNHGFLGEEGNKAKITTVHRYLSQQVMKDVLGIDDSNLEDISRTRPKQKFDLLIKKFFTDLTTGKVNSRSNAPEIEGYADELRGTEGFTNEKIKPLSLESVELDAASSPSATPPITDKKSPAQTKTRKPTKISRNEYIAIALKRIDKSKPIEIYDSICTISLNQHPCLITVGVWSFLESLTALAGREDEPFTKFLSKDRLQKLNLGDGNKTKSIRDAVERISNKGNTTKHDSVSANFEPMQLYNDMETITPVIVALCNDIITTKPQE